MEGRVGGGPIPGALESSPRHRLVVVVVVVALLSTHSAMLGWAATRHSPTMDEPAHLAAGIAHCQHRRFDLFRVNPPLVRMVAALPAISEGIGVDPDGPARSLGSRPEFDLGSRLIDRLGTDSIGLMTQSRLACIPFSLIGGLTCFLWGRELFRSAGAGLLALAIWVFEPTILGHGELITPDCGAASFAALAGYTFWRWLGCPSRTRAAVAGVTLGGGLLCKTTLILLLPVWVMIWGITRLVSRRPRDPSAVRQAPVLGLVAILGIALYVLNLGYIFRGTFEPLGRPVFSSRLFTGLERSGYPGNRFAGTPLGLVPVPLPADYLLGIDLQRLDFETHSRPSYLKGMWRERGGWWYYYLYGLLVKVPNGLQAIFILQIAWTLLDGRRGERALDWVMLLVPPAAIIAAVSAETSFSHNYRYILPAFGFLIVAAGGIVRHCRRPRSLRSALVAALAAWAVAETCSVYPETLAYFNAGSGGSRRGSRHMLHSSIDWGQGLLALKERWAGYDRPGPAHVLCDVWYDPAALGIESAPLGPDAGGQEIAPGLYAVSLNFLMGYPGPYSRCGGRYMVPTALMARLRRMEPVDILCHSLYIFRVTRHGD